MKILTKTIKFTFNNNKYEASWNTLRNGLACVDIKNREPTKGYQGVLYQKSIFYMYSNFIEPAFKWQYTTEEHKELYYFLEGVNFYEVLKPVK